MPDLADDIHNLIEGGIRRSIKMRFSGTPPPLPESSRPI